MGAKDRSKMKEQEVYIKVFVEEELPPESGWYYTYQGQSEFVKSEDSLEYWKSYVKWWLKPITAIVLTPEEMKEEMVDFKVFCVNNYVESIVNSDNTFKHRFRTDEQLYGLYLQSKEDKPTR